MIYNVADYIRFSIPNEERYFKEKYGIIKYFHKPSGFYLVEEDRGDGSISLHLITKTQISDVIKTQTVSNYDFSSDVWDWSFPELWIDAKKQKPYVTYGANEFSFITADKIQEIIERYRKNLNEAFGFDFNTVLLPKGKTIHYSNLPNTVYFNDKKESNEL